MKNFVQCGDMVTVVSPTGGVISGHPVLIGSLFGVAATTAPEGSDVEIATEGVFELPKSTAFDQGDKVYFDPTTKAIGAAATGRPWIGVAVEAVTSGPGNVRVRLNHQPID